MHGWSNWPFLAAYFPASIPAGNMVTLLGQEKKKWNHQCPTCRRHRMLDVPPSSASSPVDRLGTHHSFILPATCYAYIAWYGMKGHLAVGNLKKAG